MTTDPNQFLKGGGGPAAKFPTIGTTVRGTVKNVRTTQQTDLEQRPKFYDDGNPMEQLEITLLTAERDADNPSDDGVRRLFVKGQMKIAVGNAVGEHDVTDIGAVLSVTYVGDKPAAKKGHNPAKQFEASYAPASISVGAAPEGEEPF